RSPRSSPSSPRPPRAGSPAPRSRSTAACPSPSTRSFANKKGPPEEMATEQQSRPALISVERAEQLLKEFVSIPSVNGDKTTAHLWMTRQLEEIGMSVEHYPVEGKPNPLVLGVLDGEGDGPGVLFDAHFDTVHAVPEDWSHNPWDPYGEDGVLYGRGAVDSKGTVVSMLMAAKAVAASGQRLSGPLYLMS